MARRVVDDPRVASYTEAEVVTRRSIASVIVSVLTVAYSVIVSVIGLDTLLRALGARQANGFVHGLHQVARPFLAPFGGMFAHQRYWATALIAALVYTIAYVIALAALGRDSTIV